MCLQIRAGVLTGAASEAATFRAPPAPPDKPAQPRAAQRTRNTVVLRWLATMDNGARILHYVVEMDSGEGYVEIAKARNKQHTINALRPQTCYRVRLAAVNDCGRGEWSDELSVWTAGAPPAAPAVPDLVTAATDSLTLAWQRRAPEEEFTLQMDDRTRGHGFLAAYSGHDQTYVCDGLRRATEYRFRLRCETVDGQGPWSPEVSYSTLPERPGPPGRPAVRGKVHSRAFRLKWDAPADDGGAQIDSYLLEVDEGEGYREAYSGVEREAHCDRLQPGTAYRARICCSSVAGVSDWSTAETVVTEATCPGPCAPPELAGKPRATSAAVRWHPPDFTGGAVVTEYNLDVVASSGETRSAYSGPLLECIVRELTPGAEYRVHVTAHNRVGAGPPSSELALTAAAAPPDAPSALLATVESPTCARLEWDASNDNGAPVLDYRLEMSTVNADESFSEIYKGLETAHSVNNLVPFTPYFFRVCATNLAGRGAFSAIRDVLMPRASPAAPPALRYEATADSLRVFWKTPADRGAAILKYKLEIDDTAGETDGVANEHLFAELAPETTYRVRVAAVNELGTGEWAECPKAATRPPPPRPPLLECVQRAHNYLKIKWGEGAAADTTQYCLEMRGPDGRDFRPAYRGSARSYKAKKLRENSSYCFRIRASDDRGGRGDFSEPFSATTSAAPPPAPRAPTLEAVSPRGALARWEPVELADSYCVQMARGRDAAAVFKPAWEGAALSCSLPELEPGAELQARVCAVRGGLAGGWSSATKLQLPAAPPPAPRVRRARPVRRLTARYEALLLVGGFLVVAVAVAVLMQRLVEGR